MFTVTEKKFIRMANANLLGYRNTILLYQMFYFSISSILYTIKLNCSTMYYSFMAVIFLIQYVAVDAFIII